MAQGVFREDQSMPKHRDAAAEGVSAGSLLTSNDDTGFPR